MPRIFVHLLLLAFAAAIPGRALSAQEAADERAEPSLEGAFNDWSLYGLQENGNPVCYLSSGLERSSDTVPRKRPAVVLITNRPAEGRKGVVSVDPGYIYEDSSQVLMSIGRRQFHLYTKGGQAWAEDGDDPQIIQAIRTGSTLVVTGRMKSGTATTDTFSLRGFGAALAALDRACPIAGEKPAPVPRRTRKKKR
ncbi:MAG TPA: invasion associated locus B family protein [Alphaproteobacteria bacterium]|jgi:invasion protein IalB|nr:invasion associated locus B family protein [Alphaproteobacteria bacterium]